MPGMRYALKVPRTHLGLVVGLSPDDYRLVNFADWRTTERKDPPWFVE
jgi:hypothetical protein